jgi:hypothetical protein
VTPFNIHFDDAPTVYINGDETAVNFSPNTPGPMARGLEQTMGPLQIPNPITLGNEAALAAMADPVEEKMLHMVTADPLRTPNFTFFGNADFFFDSSPQDSAFCSIPPIDGGLVCEDNGFAWNHGDIQPEIGTTWLGLVGPGIRTLRQTGTFFSDHTDDRPTILALAGLCDDYEHDGRVLVEALKPTAIPPALAVNLQAAVELAQAYKDLNAPFGTRATESLVVSTNALNSTSSGDATYIRLDNDLAKWTSERDTIVGQMKAILDEAAFQGVRINVTQAHGLIQPGQSLINQVTACATGGTC